jgi:hypothetical protein
MWRLVPVGRSFLEPFECPVTSAQRHPKASQGWLDIPRTHNFGFFGELGKQANIFIELILRIYGEDY